MNLKVLRKTFTQKCTLGDLLIDDVFECFTLEDCVRPVKIKGITAIPAGAYEVVINFSERFKKPLPLLLNVPNFDGIRIHPGNTDRDTEGCILVGQTKQVDSIGDSRKAFQALFSRMQEAAQKEKIFLEVVNGGPSGT
jgi:hypothetical protein